VSLNSSCAQPGDGHFLNPTTVRSFLTLVERVAGFGKLFIVPEALRGHFLQQRLRLLQIARVETFAALHGGKRFARYRFREPFGGYGLKHEAEGYRANAELQSTLFYLTNCGLGTRVEFCATPPEILAYAARVFRQMG